MRYLALIAGAFFVCTSAQADSVASGMFNISGNVTLQSSAITFGSPATFGTPATGPFASLTSGTTAIGNIASTSSPAATNWIMLPDGINLNLTTVLPGVDSSTCSSNAPGSVCTPSGSPYSISQVSSTQADITFVLEGTAYSGSFAGGSSPFVAIFTDQLAGSGATITNIVAELNSTGVANTYSANFTVTGPASVTPEPGTLISSMTGLLLIGWRVAERKRWSFKNRQ